METSRHSKRRANTHKALMHSAKVLFEENGISNVTIEKIAEVADVSRSTFFTHFASLDDLLNQIADEEIDDIYAAAENSDKSGMSALFSQLTQDTYPYPNLITEYVTRSILSDKKSSVSKVLDLIKNEIDAGGYGEMKKTFSANDISALIFGAYFGLVYYKLANKEPFEDPEEINGKINNFIKFINREENNNE